MTELKARIAHLGEHAAFIRGEHAAIVIVDEGAEADSSRAAQIDIADGLVGKHAPQDQRRIELREMASLAVDAKDVAKAALVECKPALRIVSVKLLCLDGETVGRERTQEDAVKPEAQIFVDDFLDAIEASLRGRHEGAHAIGAKHVLRAPDAL